MKFWDLIKMSCSNLWRRKLRTFLTILGVVIGTASIVVMVSLGLGLNKTTMDEMENSGGLTTIQVYEGGSAMMGFAMAQEESADQGSQEQKRITDEAIEQIGAIPHVTLVSPVLNLSMMAKQGRYIGDGKSTVCLWKSGDLQFQQRINRTGLLGHRRTSGC